MITVSRAGLRKEPRIMYGKEESTLFLSQMYLPTMRTVSVQRTCPGQEVWKNKATPLGPPTRQEKDSTPTQGTTAGGKKETT